jgi:hypothetical protein
MTPTTEAIWEAFNEDEPGVFVSYADNLAAAIEALADQVVPEEDCNRQGMRPGGTGALSPAEAHQDQRQRTRRQLLAIAKELKE